MPKEFDDNKNYNFR